MRTAAAAFILVGLVASPLTAQDRNRRYGIPPGHLPPPGECRVWYDNRPPGQQPPPTSCRQAERTASRDRDARVIYGGDRDRGRATPRDQYPYPDRYPSRDRYPGAGNNRIPFDNGYKDGYDNGREDARELHAYDPERESRYRSADRGYDRRYGSKEQYKDLYRDGFRAGYDDGYRDRGTYSPDRRGSRFPWPF